MNKNRPSVPQIFELLEGSWQIERDVSNLGKFSGRAQFLLHKPGLLFYTEQGSTRLHAGTHVKSTQFYKYLLNENSIEVYFPDTSTLFYKITDLIQLENSVLTRAHHLCNQDSYSIEYEFFNVKKFMLTYRVEGPKKNYCSTSLFTK